MILVEHRHRPADPERGRAGRIDAAVVDQMCLHRDRILKSPEPCQDLDTRQCLHAKLLRARRLGEIELQRHGRLRPAAELDQFADLLDALMGGAKLFDGVDGEE